MSRYITTRTVLAVTTLTSLVAIAQAVTSHHSGVNAIEATPKALTNSAVESTANAASAPLSQVQLAVLLEGFDWQVPLAAIRSAGGGQLARRGRMTSSSMWAELPSTTDKIARLACSFLTNRVPETNFPLKNLD